MRSDLGKDDAEKKLTFPKKQIGGGSESTGGSGGGRMVGGRHRATEQCVYPLQPVLLTLFHELFMK